MTRFLPSLLTVLMTLTLALPGALAETGETAVAPAAAEIADTPAAPVDPKTRISALYEEIKVITAAAEDQDAIVKAFETKLDELFDYTAFAKRTLKQSWPKLSEEQRKTFIEHFKLLIVNVYAKRFKPKTDFAVTHRGEVSYKKDNTRARVATTVSGKKMAADVDYTMLLTKAGWYAYDLYIDTVSMALNWRRHFDPIVENEGFDALIKRIDERIEK